MYNSIEYSDPYSKTWGSLWQYYRAKPALNDNGNIIDFPKDNNNSISFKFKQPISNNSTKRRHWIKDVEIMVLLEYQRIFEEHLKFHQLILKLVLCLIGQKIAF